jgi:ATP-binding cassette subfamily B protein
MIFHGGPGWFSYLNAPEEKPRVTWALLRRVLRYARPYRWPIAGMLVMILVLRDLIDRTLPRGDLGRLRWLAGALLVIPLASGAVNVFQRRLNASVGEGVIYDLRVALYRHLQAMSLRFFTNTKAGELMSRLNNDVVGAQNAISNTIVALITNLVQTVALVLVMLALEWRLTLVSIVILPLFILVARRLSVHLRDIMRRQMEANAHMNAMMNETLNIGGALLVKLFGRARVEVDRFQGRAREVRDLGIRRAVMGAVFFIIVGLLAAVGTALVYGIGGYLVIRGTFTIGTIVAFGAYLGNLYMTLQGLAAAPVEFATSVVSFERVFEVIDLPLDIDDRPGARPLPRIRGELVFDDVSFRYEVRQELLLSDVQRIGQVHVAAALSGGPGAPRGDGRPGPAALPPSQAREWALEHVTFRVQPGELVALVGPSGAGKTTLSYLIPRLYDPSSGRILMDGHDLRDVTLDSVADQVGMVTQETYLFHDTIRTNLLYARLDAGQADVEAAARAANIHDFILGLPHGYDTVVGERGYRLSGGERQRLALARVILKDPRILVLDEATSHLDSESEALIQEALRRVMAGRTSLVIAHRLSTILAADQILVFDRGRIVESGNHAALLEHDGLYARLYETQFRGELQGAAPNM